jgi:hypothetical protein
MTLARIYDYKKKGNGKGEQVNGAPIKEGKRGF